MAIVRVDEFNLEKIALSGQCFRMRRLDDGSYGVAAMGQFVRITELGDGYFDFSCSEKELQMPWAAYFDLFTDYARFYDTVDETDGYLKRAVDFSRGLRILRQDPWEVAVSFILSQRRNIPAICGCIEALCQRFGTPFDTEVGAVHAFPTPQQLADTALCDLRECSVGYRDKYIQTLARSVTAGELDLNGIESMDDESAKKALMGLYGVGEKVAHCILLFGYHRLSMFPEDVWIKRVVQQEYNGEFPIERYKPFVGVVQQCLFYYARCGQGGRERTLKT